MGLARIDGETGTQAELTSTGAVMGTVDYMAPEQALSTKNADARSDIYSLGVTLWYLLVGRPVYEGDSLMARLMAHANNPIPSLGEALPNVPEGVQALFQKMVAKKPDERYQTMTEVISDIEAALGGHSGVAVFDSHAQPGQAASPGFSYLFKTLNFGTASATAPTRTTPPLGSQMRQAVSEATLITGPTSGTMLTLQTKSERRRQRQAALASLLRDRRLLAGGGTALALLLAVIVFFSHRSPESIPEVPKTASVTDSSLAIVAPQNSTSSGSQPGLASPVNYALDFHNGKGSAVLEKLRGLNPAGPWTLEVWVTAKSPPQANGQIILINASRVHLKLETGSAGSYWLGLVLLDKGMLVVPPKGSLPAYSSEPTHLAIERRENDILFFVNGILAGSIPCNHEIPFGGRLLLGDKNLQGTIDEVRISNVARYSANFSPQKRFKPDENTVALYHFDEGKGKFGRDASSFRQDVWVEHAKWVRVDGSPSNAAMMSGTGPADLVEILTSPDYEWTEPVNLGPNINSERNDISPTISADGLCLVYASSRGASADLYECRRASVNDSWGPAKTLVGPNTDRNDEVTPWISPDGLTLLYSVKVHGGNSNNLFETKRATRDAPWQAPVELGPQINSDNSESGGAISPDGLTLYFVFDPVSKGSKDLYQARRASLDAPWQTAVSLGSSINTKTEEKSPQLLADGKTLAFLRGWESPQIMLAEPTAQGDFRVQALDSPIDYISFCLSADGQTLIFDSQRPNGFGGSDLWMSRRMRKTGVATKTPQPAAVSGKLFLNDPTFQQWVTATQALPVDRQIEAVSKKLMELNPGFDGKLMGWDQEQPGIKDGAVADIKFLTNRVADISPLRGFPGLRRINISGSRSRGILTDLSPLKGMRLIEVVCIWNPVSDLSPFQGMPLSRLYCGQSQITDLSPLEGLPLTILDFGESPVSDLSPLHGLPLTKLWLVNTNVTDLSPLSGMNLTEIRFSPGNIEKGLDVLRGMKSLQSIGTNLAEKHALPAAEFWKKYDAGEFGPPPPVTAK
jgi:hypothetical protein